MNIVIVGQGAIGLLWYHHLTKLASNTVNLLCSARATSTPEKTLFTDINNKTTIEPLLLANDEAICSADVILVCVKSYHLVSALTPLITRIKATASIVLCHNGMVNLKKLTAIPQPCYVLLTTHGSKVISDFHAQHTGTGQGNLGLISGTPDQQIEKKLVTVLSAALPPLALSADIKQKQWVKLAINCVINPLTAIDNIKNGEIIAPRFNQTVDNILQEVITVAASEGIHFSFNELKAQVLGVAKKTAENCSSMRSDIINKRKTEIDFINGYLVSIAKEAGIDVSENEALVRRVNAL